MALFQMYNIDPTIEDRWVKLTQAQQGTIKDIQDMINSHQIALMVRPTGFGKTHLMIDFAKAQQYKKVLFVYPTEIIKNSVIAEYHPKPGETYVDSDGNVREKELKFVMSDKEQKERPDLPFIEFCSYSQMLEDFNHVYRFYGEKPWAKLNKAEKSKLKADWESKSASDKEKLQVAWLEGRMSEFELMILDEAHRCGAEGFMSYWPYIHKMTHDGKKGDRLHVLGATGTPIRTAADIDIEEDIFYYIHGHKHSARIRDFGFEDSWKYEILKRPHFVRGILDKEQEKLDIMEKVKSGLEKTSGLSKAKIELQFNEIEGEVDDILFRVKSVPEILVSGVDKIQPGRLAEGVYMRFMVFHADTSDMVKYSKDIDKCIKEAFEKFGYDNINSYYIVSDSQDIKDKLSSIGVERSDVDVISNRDKKLKDNPNDGYHSIDIIHSIDMLNMGYHVGRVTGVITRRKTSSEIVYYQQIGRCMSVKANNQPLIIDLANAAAELTVRAASAQRDEALTKIKKFIDGCVHDTTQNNTIDSLYGFTGMYLNNTPLPDELLRFWYVDRVAPIYFIYGISKAMMKNDTLASKILRIRDICEDEDIEFVLDAHSCIKNSNINKKVLKSYVDVQPETLEKATKKSKKI